MNLIADAMEPYLTANTIRFGRNTPEMTAASSIRQGNAGNYDFYLALHSNGSTDGSREGTVRGIIAFYYPGSTNGRRAADIFVRNLKSISPCRKRSMPAPPPPWGRCASPACLRCCWSWDITTSMPMPAGCRTTSSPSPPIWCCP